MNTTINRYLKDVEKEEVSKYRSKSWKKKRFGIMYKYKSWFSSKIIEKFDWYKTKTARDNAFGKSKYLFRGEPKKVER